MIVTVAVDGLPGDTPLPGMITISAVKVSEVSLMVSGVIPTVMHFLSLAAVVKTMVKRPPL